MRTRLTATATLAAAALLLSACGGGPLDGKTGQEVAEAAAAALEEAGAVDVTGTMSTQGEEGEVDLHLQGDSASGTLTLAGAEIQLINVDGTAYLQGAPEFWSSFGLAPDAAAQLDGQWVVVPTEVGAAFAEFSLAGFVDELRNPDGEVKEDVTEGEVDGEDVVIVEQENGSSLKVANADPTYPFELTNSGDSTGTVTFSGFGEMEDITAPADAVNLTELISGWG
jgi:hypothetical protein